MGRLIDGPFASRLEDGANGVFLVQGPCGQSLRIIASSGDHAEAEGWEHVSVSTRRRPPNWQEMCFVKDLFWEDEECVIQYHPPRSEYVNNHPYCLHLWRNTFKSFPLPPSIMVGVKDAGLLTQKQADRLLREMT